MTGRVMPAMRQNVPKILQNTEFREAEESYLVAVT